MGRDTIQLEDAVSTISGEYLLEFTLEYGIPEGLHPKVPGLEETIVDFPEGKIGVYTKFFEFANYRIPLSQFFFNILGYYQIHLSQLSVIGAAKMSFSKRPRKNTLQCYTKPLDSLNNWNNQFFWVDERVFPTVVAWRTSAPKDGMSPADSYSSVDVATLNTLPQIRRRYGGHNQTSESSGAPFAIEKSPLDFANENPTPLITEKDGTEEQVQDGLSGGIPPVENPAVTEVIPELDLGREMAAMGPLVNKKRRKRGNDEADANAPPKVLRKDHAVSRPTQSTLGGKSLASMRLEAGSTFSAPASQETPADVSDPDPLSYAKLQPILEQDIAQSSKGAATAGDPDSEKSSSFTSMVGSPSSIYHPGWGVTNNYHLDTPDVCQDMVDHIVLPRYFLKLRHLPNDDFLSQYNINLARQVAMGSQLRLRFEQEVRLLKKATVKIAKRGQRIQAREEEIKKLDQEIKSLRAVDTEVQGLRNQTRNLETLLKVEVDMKKAAEAKNAELTKELESLRAQFTDLQVS
ncbi:hypothetical protein Tco_1458492, partial [Tanacetum coccineum]